jgi:hypothetical protein
MRITSFLATLYCLPPVRMTAYMISLPPERPYFKPPVRS